MERAILGEGDLLYIPPFYFHHVTSLTPSISINIYNQTDFASTIKSIWNKQKVTEEWFVFS